MAAVQDTKQQGHQRTRSSVLRSFVHRRQPSKGEAIVPEPLQARIEQSPERTDIMGVGVFTKNNPGALGELQKNQQEAAPRLYRQTRDELRSDHVRGRSHSPTKGVLGSNPFSRGAKSRETSPSKPKSKTGTNFVGLLSRPKSLKSLYKLSSEQGSAQLMKDKENQTPDEDPLELAPPPPIFAQFTSDASVRNQFQERQSMEMNNNSRYSVVPEPQQNNRPAVKERPKSFQVAPRNYQPPSVSSATGSTYSNGSRKASGSNPDSSIKSQRNRALRALTGMGHSRSKSTVASPVTAEPGPELMIDPRDINKHLEAMLDRRNIPENQRYKMRNLNDTIKMEFIRQDWAEMQAAKPDRPGTTDSSNSVEGTSAVAAGSDCEAEKQKRTRGRSFTFSRGKKEANNTSPKKNKGEGTLGRHFRSKSTDSVVSEKDRPTSVSSSSTSTILSKIKFQHGPADYVSYLRKVQQPEQVEVGKIHKLRLLLRNETVAWIEEFLEQGGMKEIVDLLNRIMDVEWREEHEDALLHENLLCIKALSTTAKAMQYLDSIHKELFPKLLHLLFDPEKKGPSEFTTRNIITSILFTYIDSASPTERLIRAKSVLGLLRDPQPKEEERPLAFVLEMRQDRPYRVWNREVVSVTKEVFWIFLHNLNVIALPSTDKKGSSLYDSDSCISAPSNDHYSYMMRHFPQERPPVPAAPYVGGVEWDATNYLASHLDLLNAILACTPTAGARNALRGEMRISGWDRCMGGSLRLCKEKFYGSVHDGLRTWVAAAAEDGWDVKDVRYGPPPEVKSPPKKVGGGQKPRVELAPKIEMPKLDFGLPPAATAAAAKAGADDDGWI
ncbi:unnamed protein product [Clonostachys rhizophaga]|uniref:Formin GTPase-binding domain-containing protein n=1 Tax=Clonostachys rhizophaga TaxID=160324 RepID=A0A9N9V7M5_9HYPO|nr:unnamed protein product [Clonostachys rhizophaga]